MRKSVLDVYSVAIPVVSDGPEWDTQAVVCLHGNPGSSADWFDLMPRVAPFARIVAPDMPGFGEAAKPRGFNYSVDNYTHHLTKLLRRLCIERAHLVLHDFGVAWGLSWALRHPDSLASLTLVNVGVQPGYRWHILARIWRTPRLGELAMASVTRAGFALSLGLGQKRKLPKTFIDGMYANFDPATRRAVLQLYRATDDLGGLFAPQAAALRSWTCPVCVVWGARDPYISPSYAERQREFFPAAEITVFEDSGHWPHADDPERFASVVVPFLRRARAAA